MADLACPPNELYNPLTPMAFLPPQLAVQVTTGTYVLIGGCAVLVWDIVDNLRADYRLITEKPLKIRIPTMVYFISRLGTLGFALSSAIFGSAALTWDCRRFLRIVGAFYPITTPATSFLFFLRLRAVFDRDRVIVAVFAFIWIALFGSTFTVPIGLIGGNIGPTKYCMTVEIRKYIIAPTIISFIHDTLVLLAISWRLMTSTHTDPDIRKGVKTMVFGDYLPSFSRALLHDGQRFYTATVSLNLLTVIMFFIDSVPPIYRLMFSIPNVALMNIMACRVFRNTKFGLSQDTLISTSVIYSRERARSMGPHAQLPLKFNRTLGSTFEMSKSGQQEPFDDSGKLAIHIAKRVEYEPQGDFHVSPGLGTNNVPL
ncbi:hypothetical protein BJ165DRAFT_1527886 [Panaeolus papilionaceus]|nr:hypothetical protein BJ165DRAFT_1527886 [Panaeolus papilionaceus]